MTSTTSISLGIDNDEQPVVQDLQETPHMLTSTTVRSGRAYFLRSVVKQVLLAGHQLVVLRPADFHLGVYDHAIVNEAGTGAIAKTLMDMANGEKNPLLDYGRPITVLIEDVEFLQDPYYDEQFLAKARAALLKLMSQGAEQGIFIHAVQGEVQLNDGFVSDKIAQTTLLTCKPVSQTHGVEHEPIDACTGFVRTVDDLNNFFFYENTAEQFMAEMAAAGI